MSFFAEGSTIYIVPAGIHRCRSREGSSLYGLVNKAIEDYVSQEFGVETWEKILERAAVAAEVFISIESYPDEWTYKLVNAASEVLGLPADTILIAFGEYWIRFTEREGYGHLLTSCGRNLPQFLKSLDNLHSHAGLIFPQSRMPSFKCVELGPDLLQVDYFSERPGLGPMVIGLLKGLGSLFENTVEVEFSQSRASGADHD